MFLLTDGGPFALLVAGWVLVMLPLLAYETRRSPSWFPGLHAGLLGVLFGLGTTGWLFGLDMVGRAIHNSQPEHTLQLAAVGNSVATYPFLLAAVVAGVFAPWMA